MLVGGLGSLGFRLWDAEREKFIAALEVVC